VGKLVAAVGEHPQCFQLTIGSEHPQPFGADRDDRDRVSIKGVGLAVVAGIEEPDPGGELGRDVNDLLAGLDQALGQWPAGTVGAFDRPDPVRLRLHVRPHRCVATLVGGEAARPEQVFLLIDDLDGG
jgi:hypothetical protein